MAAWAYYLPPVQSAWNTSQWLALCHPLHHMTAVTTHCPFFFVHHYIGPSIVNLHTTRYGGVHIMVAWHMCLVASISIGCVRSAWLLIGTSLVSRVSVLLQVLGGCGGLLPLNPAAMAGTDCR
jgi:hypothetical protein